MEAGCLPDGNCLPRGLPGMRNSSAMGDMKPLLTLEEAAQYLGVSKTSLRRWTNDGQLACHRIGVRGERRFERDMLDAFRDGRKDRPADPSPVSSLIERVQEAAQEGRHQHVAPYFRNPAEQWE